MMLSRRDRRGGGAGSIRALELLHHQVVDVRPDELADLVAARLVDRLADRRRPPATRCTTSGSRCRRRPSRAASTRAGGDVTWPLSSVWCSSRIGTCQHTFGFQSSGRSPASSAAMCNAQPTPPCEAGPVQEDAGIVDEARDRGRLSRRRRARRTHEAASHGLVMELHLLGLEPHERPHDDLHVVVVDEVGAVAAASLLRAPSAGAVEHALAALAVDALVVRPQERRVEHPGPLLVGILEARSTRATSRSARTSASASSAYPRSRRVQPSVGSDSVTRPP